MADEKQIHEHDNDRKGSFGSLGHNKKSSITSIKPEYAAISLDGTVVNASGHPDQLNRHFGLLAICGMALTVDSAWVVLGLSLSLSIGRRVV